MCHIKAVEDQNNIGLFKFCGERNNRFNFDKPIFK